MLKETITYDDFDGKTVVEDIYFNLTKAELVEWEMSVDGGLKEHLETIINTNNGREIMAAMKDVILRAYGARSDDNRRFIKNPQLREEFESSEAYSVIFMKLAQDPEAAAKFVNGIIPKDLLDEAEKMAKKEPSLADRLEPKKLTEREVREMDPDELRSGLATGKYVIENDTPQ